MGVQLSLRCLCRSRSACLVSFGLTHFTFPQASGVIAFGEPSLTPTLYPLPRSVCIPLLRSRHCSSCSGYSGQLGPDAHCPVLRGRVQTPTIHPAPRGPSCLSLRGSSACVCRGHTPDCAALLPSLSSLSYCVSFLPLSREQGQETELVITR